MRKRRLGTHGPDITTVGLGSWTFGGAGGFGLGPVDDQESIATIRRAVESGINWIDSAAVYGLGHSEEVVGRAISPWRVGEDVYVFTKCGQNWYGSPTRELIRDLRPASIRFECEQSLQRLRVERIDLYQFHWPDTTGTPVEDSWGTMVELINEGKVRWGGVSNFGIELLERCQAIRPVDSLQTPLSLLNRSARADVIPWCRQHDVGVLVYAPMATGLLTGSLDRDRIAGLADDDGRRRLARFRDPHVSSALDFVARLKPIADRVGITLPSLAVAWTLAVPGVTGAIAGARRPDQVDGWLPAADGDLTSDTLALIDQAIADAGV
ncbi:MAG: aldo/keto reductase [Armatimonadota bacterium]